nr:thioredoxin-dependent peroxide reductase (TPXR) [Polytomella parva]|eukprot:CAMPEP_0175049790 /NCGR_PEP_ID=MMETSP0052_2-20121109/6915_1 /TAXON_ID=51329 ORGANISM="Polytomella parva, Strain SAG 63-3" /NCGR_SAMPLE_ID=MMETSP0052_2 /ASSEMBLY_ACC=CAM_ASM_000194 /LENGTH=359 /DNA_ID=CAMNT_0016313953 /DNA_START=1378 /DNA_END=2457 /DNA_ORIENTATION=+
MARMASVNISSATQSSVASYRNISNSLRCASTGITYPSVEARVGVPAPDFTAPAIVDGEIKPVSLQDYKGKYVVLFFYPKDFTFVCPTEIIAFSDRAKEFEALGAQVIAASTDTPECHLAWIKTPRNRGGLGYMQIPIVADVTKSIAARYGVLVEKAGIALRGLFIINPSGVIQQVTVNDFPIGRSVDETLRLLQAIQYHAKHGEVCPANWTPGAKTMIADPEKSLEYFSSVKEAPVAASTDGAGSEEIASKVPALKSKAEFEAAVAEGSPLVVDFYAPWCGKCRQIGPFVDELVAKYPNVRFAKLDTSAAPLEEFAGQLAIKALPAFRFYKGGKEVLEQVTGYKKKPLEEGVSKLGGL